METQDLLSGPEILPGYCTPNHIWLPPFSNSKCPLLLYAIMNGGSHARTTDRYFDAHVKHIGAPKIDYGETAEEFLHRSTH